MILILTGTRPELIKMAPVIKELASKKIPFYFVHSGQHYTKQMDADIIADLDLPEPDANLRVGSASHAVQTGKIMEGVERICLEIKPSYMVVHGDTNTTLSGALVAKKLHIPVAHIEAGLRSFDYTMPEEVNRILVDRISDTLFAPTEEAKANLLKEGIDQDQIVVTGNTVVDALQQHVGLATRSRILETVEQTNQDIKKGFILLTAHRPENVDSQTKLEALFSLLEHAHGVTGKTVVWPIHPRTANSLVQFNLEPPSFVTVIEPVGYLDMLQLMTQATLILTDSGGIQEEAYLLQKPLMTLRENTERPETLSANFIIHFDRQKFDDGWKAFQTNQVVWGNQLGNGDASNIIVATLEKHL